MATRMGFSVLSPMAGQATGVISTDLDNYVGNGYPGGESDVGGIHGAAPRARAFPVSSLSRERSGWRPLSYMLDFYYRIHVIPQSLNLGNLLTEQVRTVRVWNAWPDASHTMTDAEVIDGSGMTLVPPDDLPLVFTPLGERVFELEIVPQGAPTIAARIVFTFDGIGEIEVPITGQRIQAWPVMADWGNDVGEFLEWLTDEQLAENGNVDSQPLRSAPRRGWEFDILEGRTERRIVENAAYDGAGQVWALPVMPDVSLLTADLPAEITSITLDTVGLDYRDGGLLMLWHDALRFEIAEIDTVASGAITLARPTGIAWPRGTRVYPCRTARLTDAPQWRRRTDRVVTARVRFETDEPCDWPAIPPAITYRGFPVIDAPGDEGDDPTAQPSRRLTVIDGDTGLVATDDVTGLAWHQQSHAWMLFGRAERAAHRSLLYWLEGRAERAWLPTFADDVEILDPVNEAATTLTVANAGIAMHLRGQPGRRHLRIALHDGTVYYREVLGSTQLDSARESLQIDTPLGVTLQPGRFRLVSWMALSRLSSDRVELAHVTDSHGVSRCRVGFVFAGAGEPAA